MPGHRGPQTTLAEDFVQALLVEQRGAATALRGGAIPALDMYIYVNAKKVRFLHDPPTNHV